MRRNAAVSPGPGVLQQVVLHDPHLVIRDVLELIRRRHVTEREHPSCGGALELVDDDAPARPAPARRRRVELVPVRLPSDRDQQRVTRDDRAVGEHDLDTVTDRAELLRRIRQVHVPLRLRDAREPLGDVRVEVT